MICYRVVTSAAWHARRLVHHIGRGLHHAALHPAAAVVSVVCVGAPVAMWGMLPAGPVALSIPRVVAPYTPAPDWAADKWWQDRTDYLPEAPAEFDDGRWLSLSPALDRQDSLAPAPDSQPTAIEVTKPTATDIPAPAMGWIVLLPLALRRWWK